jgi:hypothetical protein
MATINHNLRFVAVLAVTFVLAACVGVFFIPPKIAHATFPGVNGKIAFEGSGATGDSEIYTIDPTGGTLLNVTDNTTNDRYPSYSPDGTKIAYVNFDGIDSIDIYTINASGGTPSRLTNNTTDDINPSWGIAHNDAFAYARQIDAKGGDASVTGTTEGASREAGEPDHYTSNPADADDWLGDHTVWYSWKAPASGSTTIDTCQADIDSILAVYTGSTLDTLKRVADNNNDHAYCPSESWGSKVTFNATAGTTYRIAVGDAGVLRENTFTLKLSAPRDTQAPKVSSASPASKATGVVPGANITATFSEDMMTNSINNTTFKLSKAGTTSVIGASVSYDPTTKKATLNPDDNLRRGAKYKAVVTTGATDLAGNKLDQNRSQSGLQQKAWTFTIRN